MRSILTSTLVCALLMTSGCQRARYVPPESPMPPNTILLSQMMRELSARPGFTDSLIAQIDKVDKKGPALLTPALVDDLRKRTLGEDWSGLDRFPGWTMRQINPTVRAVGHEVGKSEYAENLSAVHPGASSSAAETREFLDLGPYVLDKAETLSLDTPSTLPAFSTEGIVTPLGNGIVRGDGPNELAPEHSESQRLADALNRLAVNKLEGAQPFVVGIGGQAAITPQNLITLLQKSGHDVTVTDARYFTNFAHLHYNGQDVMAPFWIDSQIVVPNSGGRPLLVPVAHAEYDWRIRGPLINADISYYFGVDGKSQWRTMDTLDQAWVLKRDAHVYRDNQAIEVTRLASLLTIAYMHLHAAHPSIPFGGYYALGVCQDGVSAIEMKLTGNATLFPNTADDALFNDPRDAEVNALIAAIPKDRDAEKPAPERVFGSLPVQAGPNSDYSAITIPGLAADLHAAHEAWTNGKLVRAHSRLRVALIVIALLGIAAIAINLTRRRNIEDFEG